MELIDPSLSILLILCIIVFASSIISTVTGMAGGIIMLSGMNVFIPLSPLIPLHGAVQLFSTSARAWLLKRHLLTSMCLPFLFGAVLGAAGISMLMISLSPSHSIPFIILATLIAYTLFKPSNIPDIKIKHAHYFWVGIATGALGILVGAVDPLLGAFFYRDDLTKEEVVANKSLMAVITHLTKIPAYIFLGFSFIDHAMLIAILSLAGLMATKIGVLLLGRIDQNIFRVLMWWALFFTLIRLVSVII